MIRRSFIGFGTVVALVGATACGDADEVPGSGGHHQGDAEVRDDGGDAEELDGSMQAGDGDGDDEGDGDGDDEGDGDGDGSADGGMDAATDTDAEVPMDAQVQDSGSNEQDAQAADAGSDASTEDAGSDASTEDAGADASTEDAGLPALAAHYTFDENTGTTAADSAGEFADAELKNGANWTTGVDGSALDLAGGASNNYASLPANILDGCGDITVALWMKLGSETRWTRLLDIDGVVDGFLFFTATEDVGGQPHLLFNIFHPPGEGRDDQGVSAAYPSGTTLVDQWHHVAFTLSGGTGRLYFNGAEIGSAAMSTKPSDLTLSATAHAWLGRSTFANDAYLDASIDDLRISCTAYTAEQVAAIAAQ